MSTYEEKTGTQDEENAAATAPAKCPVSQLAASFDPFDIRGNNYGFYTQARKEGAAFYYPPLDSWIVSHYNEAERIFKDSGNGTFSALNALQLLKPPSQEALGKLMHYGFAPKQSLVDEDPPIHRQHRQALQKHFTVDRIRALEPYVRDLVTRYVDRFVKRGKSDLVKDLVYDVPCLVIFHIMAVPEDKVELVRKYAQRWSVFTWGLPSDEEQVEVAEGMGEYWAFSKTHVEYLMENPGADAISDFIKELRKPGNEELWDIDYVYTVMLNLLMAGHETTTNASAAAFRALLTQRSEWERLCTDPSLIPNAVEECLRFETSVPTWRQLTAKATKIGDVEIPEGASLYVAVCSANHDETKFEDPEKLDVQRKNAKHHLTFGSGRHTCLGNHLARMEMRIILEELTRRLPHMQLVAGQPWTYSPNTSQRGPEHVLVTWDPAQNPIPEDRP